MPAPTSACVASIPS